MAIGILTITWKGRGPQRIGTSKKLWGSGKVTLSANSVFAASAIERQFPNCENIVFQAASGFQANYTKSATANAGVIKIFASANGTFVQEPCFAGSKAYFTAYGK